MSERRLLAPVYESLGFGVVAAHNAARALRTAVDQLIENPTASVAFETKVDSTGA